jgi:hypothetical protein
MAYKSAKVYTGSEWVDLAVSVASSGQRGVQTVSGTSYTLAEADAGKEIVFTSGSAVTVTVPAETTYDFTVGQTFVLFQKGAGAVSVAAAVGVTLRSRSSYVKTSGQYAELSLIKIAANEWALTGDLAAS